MQDRENAGSAECGNEMILVNENESLINSIEQIAFTEEMLLLPLLRVCIPLNLSGDVNNAFVKNNR